MQSSGGNFEVLPPLYAAWMSELLPGAIPRESKATCDDCAMCPRDEESAVSDFYYFDPATKCCTFVPELYNFLVGAVLSDTDPDSAAGRATVEKRLAEGIAVTPLGLGQPAVFLQLYNNATRAFGRTKALRCPHYLEDGRCGVWRSRESTCATWFCKHVRGQISRTFWRESLHRLLGAAERDLSRWCVLQAGLDPDALRSLFEPGGEADDSVPLTGEDLDNRRNRERYHRIWGEWDGREAEFFIKCAKLVRPLKWNDVLTICGPAVQGLAHLTFDAYTKLVSEEVPSELKSGSFQLVQIKGDTARVDSYNDFDPIDIPTVILALLSEFDGRSTEDVTKAIAVKTGVQLDPALIRKLYDFGVLVPAAKPRVQESIPKM